MQFKILNERALSAGEPCTCQYVTFLQSFDRGILSIHWYIAHFKSLLNMAVLEERLHKTDIENVG